MLIESTVFTYLFLQCAAVGMRPHDDDSCTGDLTEDVLQPQLEPTQQEAAPLHSSLCVLTQIEAGQYYRPWSDEEAMALIKVHITSTVKALEGEITQLDVLNLYAFRLAGGGGSG